MKKHIAEELPARQFKQAAMDAKGGDKKGGKSPEERVRQAVYDIRYKSRREKLPLAQAFAEYMQNSNMSEPEKALVKAKLEGKSMKEEYGIDNLASNSIANALYKVFVESKESSEVTNEELLSFYREEVIKNSRGESKYKVEVIGNDGRSYVRYATREKINDLRANPNIKSVEMTDYGEPYEGERKRGEQTAAAKAGKDYDGDGKVESGSKEHAGVVHNAIQRKKGGIPDGQDTRKESVEFIDEVRGVKKKKKKEDVKIDVMAGKNTVKVGPTDGQTIMAGYETSAPVLTETGMSDGQLKFVRMLQEKAVSQNQQQLAAMAIEYLDGNMPDASDVVKQMAKMGRKKLHDFAKTKHKGLPEKVGEETECGSKKGKEVDPRQLKTMRDRTRTSLGLMGIKASYEPEGEQIDEGIPLVVAAPLVAGGVVAAAKGMEALKNKFDAKINSARKNSPIGGDKRVPQINSYEPEGEMIDERTRYAKETGKHFRTGRKSVKGGDPEVAARNQLPGYDYGGSRQKPKVRGETPPSPYDEAKKKGVLSPLEHKVALRRNARKAAAESQMDTRGT